jgi:hypothetical protein
LVAVFCSVLTMLGWRGLASAQPSQTAQAPSQTPQPAATPELGVARSEAPERYRQLSVTANALYMVVPIVQLSADLALHARWSVGVRGGGGRAKKVDEPRTIWEIGVQGFYSFTGNERVGPDERVQRSSAR